MQPFGFNVVPENGEDGVPIAIAGQVMVDIQKLLTDIGRCMVRTEMGLQNEIPRDIVDKFTLRIGGPTRNGLGSRIGKGAEALVGDALALMFDTLNFLGQGAIGIWMDDKFKDPFERVSIAKDLIALTDHLSGNVLVYGPNEDRRQFRTLDREKLMRYTKSGAEWCRIVGHVSSDPRYKGHWTVLNAGAPVPLNVSKKVSRDRLDAASRRGAVSIIGNVSKTPEGRIISVNNAEGFEERSEVEFGRIVTSECVIPLAVPVTADVGYAAKGGWRMTNRPLGIDVSKPTWDECVLAFHNYFVFLYDSYVQSGRTFEGSDGEAQALMASFLPPAGA